MVREIIAYGGQYEEFMKVLSTAERNKTQKTPRKEIVKAKQLRDNYFKEKEVKL